MKHLTLKEAEELHPYFYDKYSGMDVQENSFIRSCTTGGSSGGGCWEGMESSSYTTGNEVTNFEYEGLDEFIEKVIPEITFIQYKRFLKGIKTSGVQYGSINEYYGNGRNIEYEAIALKTVVNYLNALYSD